MKNINFKKILPHIIAIIIFLIVAVVYCKPALEGKVVSQHDIQGWRGMSQQSMEFHEKYGYYPLWTNSMFSGMPAYQIAFDSRTKLQVGYLDPILKLGLPKPISFFFLACICFYFLCVVCGANPWVGIMGSIAYAYSTFDPIIIAVGHDTQMLSIGYMPAVLAGLILLFQKKYWAGFAVTAFFGTLLIGQNHLQMVYYTMMIAATIAVAFIIKSYKEKQLPAALKSIALAAIAGVLGLACNAVTMMPTYEYAKESMRGGRSELNLPGQSENKTKGGLDKDYAFNYSLGIPETLTFIVPGLYGGSNGGNEYTTSSKFVETFSQLGVPDDNALQYADAYSYWGNQPTTSGPVYLGAIICFLFIFGMVYVKSWHNWWVLAASILGVVLAWGANFKGINFFLFDYLPFYNKFRAPTMALVIPQLCFPFMAVLAVSKLVSFNIDFTEAWKKLKLSGIITGAILILLAGFYFSASFSGKGDKTLKDNFRQSLLQQVPQGQQPSPQVAQQADEVSRNLITALHTDRKDLMGGDLLRSIYFISLAFVIIGLFVRKKIYPERRELNPYILTAGLIALLSFFLMGLDILKLGYVIAVLVPFFNRKKVSIAYLIGFLVVLSSYDLLAIGSRYLNSNNFVDDTDYESTFNPTEADAQILKDPDHANFRVFNSSLDAFNDASTSYHHNSVGGYHPAKLGLYNDIIANQLAKGNMRVFDMLNTKYFIVQNPQTGKPVAQINPGAFGNAWLVKGIKYVDNANQEMQALDSTDLKDTAVIEKKFEPQIKQAPVPDSSATIKMKQNLNDKIEYSFHSTTPQFAVLSEIYYPAGWNAFVDGNKADYAKTNYVLRGMYVPAGDHEIEFRFEPTSFTTGKAITIVANILVFLSMIAAVVFYIRRKPKPDAHLL